MAPTFAIALVRLSDVYGWLESAGSARIMEVGERAMAHAHRLSPRYQFFIQGWNALNRGTPDGVPSLQEAVRKYPDDPGAWFLPADTYFHVGGAAYATHDDTWHALTQRQRSNRTSLRTSCIWRRSPCCAATARQRKPRSNGTKR